MTEQTKTEKLSGKFILAKECTSLVSTYCELYVQTFTQNISLLTLFELRLS